MNDFQGQQQHISFSQSDQEEDDILINPWLKEETRTIKNPNIRLHNEIHDYYDYIRPKEQDQQLRMAMYQKIKQIIESGIQGCQLYPFGSFVTELYLPNSQIDCVLVLDSMTDVQLLKEAKNLLSQDTQNIESIVQIKKGKYMSLKFVEKTSNLNFCMFFNQIEKLKINEEIMNACKFYPELKFLLYVMKMFLSQRRLNQPFNGGINTYLLFCMLIAFLRDFKKNYVKRKRNVEFLNNVSLSDYLMKFLYFYGNFEMNKKCIDIRDKGDVKKKRDMDGNFSLIDPISGEDIGKEAYKAKECFYSFKNRYNLMTNNPFQNGESILKYLINPSNQNFKKFIS